MQTFRRNLDRPLARFAETKGNARKFHRAAIGDVDPKRCFADFLHTVYKAASPKRQESFPAMDRLEKSYRSPKEKAAMSEAGGGLTGGYLVPPEWHYELMQDVGEDALVRPRAMVLPMGSATLDVPLPDASTVQAANTSPMFGGMKMTFQLEGKTFNETEPTWRTVQLVANQLGGIIIGSNPFFDDAGQPFETYFRLIIARSIAWYEDFFFIQGTGVGQPTGFITNPGSVLVSRSGGASTFKIADIATMSADLLPISWSRAQWIIHPTVWGQLPTLNTNAWQINQPIKQGRDVPDAILNGMGLWVTDKCSTLGTKGDVILADMGLYVIGDRGQIHIDVSREASQTTFNNNQAVWRVVERVDGQPWFGKTITMADAASIVSPYVVLV